MSRETKIVAGRSEAEPSRPSIDEIEARALELDRPGRVRLARKLLESLETVSDVESERLRTEKGG